MVETYETQEEEVLALRYFWEENRGFILGSVAALMIGAGGWSFAEFGFNDAREKAAENWQQIVGVLQEAEGDIIDSGEREQLNSLATDMLGLQFAGIYEDYARLLLARLALDAGDTEGARNYLTDLAERTVWPWSSVEQHSSSALARLTLGRIALSDGDLSGARSYLDSLPDEAGALAEDLAGDIALAEGDEELARASYERALEDPNGLGEALGVMVELKLAALKKTQGFVASSSEAAEETEAEDAAAEPEAEAAEPAAEADAETQANAEADSPSPEKEKEKETAVESPKAEEASEDAPGGTS
ncbi:MAG: tetratricopeptide repeat protein [Gammaproteobacteria bacterium AqS3]|nr:tetratricopeptide repeat protein [Gammaproteobacteria bacterium AqS3]